MPAARCGWWIAPRPRMPPRLASMLSDADLLSTPAGRTHGRGPGRPRRGARQPGHLLPEGVHPAHHAVPRPLRLLHVRQGAGPPRRAVPLPRRGAQPSPGPDATAGCHEALFTLGERPELRYPVARDWLRSAGLRLDGRLPGRRCAAWCVDETGLLPHANAGALFADELARLRAVTASQGMMIETLRRPGRHRGAPDKTPARRLATLEAAGELAIPFTTGILVGIGEDRRRAARGPARPSPPATPATATCRR